MSQKIKPREDESHDDFISRCMGSDTMNEEYPDRDQRYAVCESYWDDKKSIPTDTVKFELNIAKSIGMQISQESYEALCRMRKFNDKDRHDFKSGLISLGLGEDLEEKPRGG